MSENRIIIFHAGTAKPDLNSIFAIALIRAIRLFREDVVEFGIGYKIK